MKICSQRHSEVSVICRDSCKSIACSSRKFLFGADWKEKLRNWNTTYSPKYRKVFENNQAQKSLRNVYQRFKFPEIWCHVLWQILAIFWKELFGSILNLEEGDSGLLWNLDNTLPICTALHSITLEYSPVPPLEPQISILVSFPRTCFLLDTAVRIMLI
jgi:hypothetical protein